MVGDGATVRVAITEGDDLLFLDPQELIYFQLDLWLIGRNSRIVKSWTPNISDVLTDGPIFHQQDPGWRFKKHGYNFKWELPMGYLTEAPAKYRLTIKGVQTGSRQATGYADLIVSAPDSHA